jgi:hypothetical protein
LLSFTHLQQTPHKNFQQLFCTNGFIARYRDTLIQRSIKVTGQWTKILFSDRADQAFFGTEMIVNGGKVNLCCTGYFTHGGFSEALFSKQSLSRYHNFLCSCRLSH